MKKATTKKPKSNPSKKIVPTTSNAKAEMRREDVLRFTKGTIIANKYRLVNAGRFQREGILKYLGEGGSGVVYKAKQVLSDDIEIDRAVKFYMFNENIAKDLDFHGRSVVAHTSFRDEIVNLSSISHENVLKIIEAGFYEPKSYDLKIPFLVTEFIEGMTLEDALKSDAFKAAVLKVPALIIDLVLHIAKGLLYLHNKSFYHCDIAPKNIFLRTSGGTYQAIIGDLGVGKSIRKTDSSKILIAGSWHYSPQAVKDVMKTMQKRSILMELQPYWDLYGFARTSTEFLDACWSSDQDSMLRAPWYEALRKVLQKIIDGESTFTSIVDVERKIGLLHPRYHTTWEVPELTNTSVQSVQRIVPRMAVPTTPRVEALLTHPQLLRLKYVPQLLMGRKMLAGGDHDRYEHTLGIYQNTRKLLESLMRDPEYLESFSPELIELSLVCAILSNIARYPYSSILYEIQKYTPTLFRDMGKDALFDDIIQNKKLSNLSVKETVEKYFPRVNVYDIKDVLLSQSTDDVKPHLRIINYIFNSTVDVRVLDYLRRDSHHIGIPPGFGIDVEEIFQYEKVANHGIVLRFVGRMAVEEIVAYRYWLYNRVYWNKPNRSVMAMLRKVFIDMAVNVPVFEKSLKSWIWTECEEDILMKMDELAVKYKRREAHDICTLLRNDKPRIFEQILQFNKMEGDAEASKLCNKYVNMNYDAIQQVETAISQMLQTKWKMSPNIASVAIDIPKDYGMRKIGEDVVVEMYNGKTKLLSQVSAIVSGVEDGFVKQLQRIRVFVHPQAYEKIDSESKRKDLRDKIKLIMHDVV